MVDRYYLYVVAYPRFTTSPIVEGIFPNTKQANWFLNAFHSAAKIYQVKPSDIIFGEYGIELRKGVKPYQ